MRSRIALRLFTLSTLVLAAQTLHANDDVQAFIPTLIPTRRVSPVYPRDARDQNLQGSVQLLVTIDVTGAVIEAEVLTGPSLLRQAAVDAMKSWTFNPVIRNGHPVKAMSNERVQFFLPGQTRTRPDNDELREEGAASRRMLELSKRFPRSSEQVLADLENSLAGVPPREHAFWSGMLAKAAFRAGDLNKAALYARESLESPSAPRDGGLVHDGNMVLGLIALKHGGVEEAKLYLLKAGATKGGPSLNSFGPNMMLAQALIEAGERDTVLRYFEECRAFWRLGGKRLDDWTAITRSGGKPDFGANLLY